MARQRICKSRIRVAPVPISADDEEWHAAVSGLHHQLNDLGQRIDRNLP